MDPFELLGLEEDADQTTIKRAYARLLKVTRPDTDPVGFQQLHEAYQSALEYARWQNVHVAAPSADSHADAEQSPAIGLSPGTTSPMREVAEPTVATQVKQALDNLLIHADDVPSTQAFDFDAFCDEADQRAATQTPAEVSRWLQQHPALYRMSLKQDVGAALFAHWDSGDQVLRNDRLAAFSQFFDIDETHLREKMRVRWAVINDRTDEFGEAHPRVVRQLKRRFSLPQAVLTSLVPGMAVRIAALGHRLIEAEGQLSVRLQPRQFEFFAQLADPRYAGRWRWLPMLLRPLLLGVIAAVVIPWAATKPFDPLQVGALTAGGTLVVELAAWLLAWLRTEQSPSRGWSAHLSTFLPLWLALLALLIDAGTSATLLAAVLASVGALAHWRRAFDALRFMLGGLWMWSMVPQLVSHLSQWIWAMACVPIGLILFDAYYAHQHGVPLRNAAGNRWTTIASYAFFISWLAYRFLGTSR
ncbi:J domain-containing protein [Pseudoxanthomonas indica]|uniref:J domain-containing protein n=1 Tax=Pseudoxanthomonas indica TaxID=428993 RepID=A0A1T5LXL8_9GAMM|nr:J domain-containing protein [Pseudoxanthomonas indica]GGD41167.1 hypothetical protein GCM10007235_11450 [Pseudoxanthomonas indica]SKC80338.1 hypothetical protein SAMN06296058_3273 [Pseudoxanthomonas indica]